MLKYKKLRAVAKGPTVAHLFEDIAYDFYAAERVVILAGHFARIPLGVAIEFDPPMGGIYKDRSSMAGKGLTHAGGCLDGGYRGELQVILHNLSKDHYTVEIGDKIIQLVPQPVVTTEPVEVNELKPSARGEKGFGSTGK